MSNATPERPRSTGPHAAPAGAGTDRVVLALVYRDHGGAVYGLAGYLCGVEHAAEVTRRVFVAWWRGGAQIDTSPVALRTTLLTMTNGLARELLPTRRSGTPPTEACVQAVEHLPGNERDAIATALLGQCSYREVAAILGQPAEAVRSRILAGLRRLHPGPGAELSPR